MPKAVVVFLELLPRIHLLDEIGKALDPVIESGNHRIGPVRTFKPRERISSLLSSRTRPRAS